MAENYFARKAMLLELLKRDTAKLFEQGLDIIRLVNKSRINVYYNFNSQIYFDNRNHILPDFDSFMIITALKTKRVPELLKVAKGNPNPEPVIRQIKNLEKLALCPEKDFITLAGKFIKEEDNDNKRWEFQKQIVTIYKYRKLTCDLTDMMFKEIELYDKDMMQNQNRFAGLTAWLEVTAEQKDPKLLSKILSRVTAFYVKKYKKEFPNELNVRNRFYQVFPWMITNMFQSIIRTVLDKNPEKWYFVYKELKPLLQIQMFSNQMNGYYLFSQQINRDPVKFLKASPFLGTLDEIDFCPIKSNNNIGSLYSMTLARIRNNSNWKKQAEEYLNSLKKPAVGVEIFQAALKSSPDKIFEILAEPQLKFEQMPLEKQKNFCVELASVINKKAGDEQTSASKGWKIYQLYQKFTSSSNQDKVEKFYKQNVDNNPYGYAQGAGKLIADIARNNPEKAGKIFEYAIRKLDLCVIQNPNYVNHNFQFQNNLLSTLSQNCRDLGQCEIYYACLKKIKKPSINAINNFYNKLRNLTNNRYNRLNKGDQLSAMRTLLKEYENTFKNTNIILTYETFYALNNLNPSQLQELIKYRSTLKSKSKISPQIKLVLQAHLEMKLNRKIKTETANVMWAEIKNLPQEWQVALGLKMLNLQGCEQVAQYIIEPAIKMALHSNRQVSSYNIRQIAEKLALIRDDAIIKKVAPPLINYYVLEIHKWDANRLKRERASIAQILTLAYRVGNKKLVEKLLKDFKMAQYSDSYISLANLGAEELLKELLNQNWQNLISVPRLKLLPEGQACAEKVCKEIKSPEENYIVRTMFASPLVLLKRDSRNTYRTQSKVLKKLAEEFNNIKFSKKQNKIFCLQVLLHNSQDIKTLAQKSSASILALSLDDILQVDDYNFATRIGQFYFACLNHGNGKKAMEKINEIIKYKNSTTGQTAQKAINILNGLGQNYQSMDLRKVKLAQVKEFAQLGILISTDQTVRWDRFLTHAAFFNYLAGEDKKFIAMLKDVPDNYINVRANNWRHYMRNLKAFCDSNKLDAQKKISGFLDSPSVKELFKKKPEELAKLKTYYMQENCGDFKEFKTYYEALKKNSKISINEINNFYNRLQQFTRKRYYELQKKNSNNNLNTAKALVQEYDAALAGSNMPILYSNFYVFNNLRKEQMQELVNNRAALKTQKSSQLDLILKAYLEIKQKHKLSSETVNKMWMDMKDMPEPWQAALGLNILNLRGGEYIVPELTGVALKLASQKPRQINDYQIEQLINKLALIKEDNIIKKVAPPLIKYYMPKTSKWHGRQFKYKRTTALNFLTILFKSGDNKLAEKLLRNSDLPKYSDTYIVLANYKKTDLFKELLDKNYLNLLSPSQMALFPDTAVWAQTVCKKIKDPEKSYICRVLFSSAMIYSKDRNGEINYNRKRSQSKALKELAQEFGKIKFSKKQSQMFCLAALLRFWQNNDILAKKAANHILSITPDEIIKNEDGNFHYQIGRFYFACCRFGHIKAVSEKIKELIKLYKDSTGNNKYRAQHIINSYLSAYNSFNLRGIKSAQAKEFSDLGIMVLNSNVSNDRNLPWNIAFFTYLSKNEKAFTEALKNMPNKSFYSRNWRGCFNNFKHFCMYNNLKTRGEITGFLDSSSMKELFKNKSDELEKIKKDVLKSFVK
jgi:hypothetical protein